MIAPPARARRAVSTAFFLNGAVLASWVAHIPAVKERHAIGDGQLGVVLLSMAVGAVLALSVTGWLVGRVGSRIMTSAAATALCLALPLPVLSPGLVGLSLSLLLFGACNGALDVSMNAQAVAVEERYGRAIMSSFHGLFSVGGLVGAGLAGLAIAAGMPPERHVVTVALVGLIALAATLRWLVPSSGSRRGAGRPSQGRVFARPTGVLVRLGALAFCGLLAEGAMGDWSAVYLRDALGSSPALAAAGFAGFSLAMAAGRFGGDALVAAFGASRVLRASGAIAAVGLGAALLVDRPAAGVIGCGAVGLGIANVIPILFSAAGRAPGVSPATALATVATTGYLGFLAGPPVIGLVAELAGLPVGLGIVSVLCAAIAAGSGALRVTKRRASPASADVLARA